MLFFWGGRRGRASGCIKILGMFGWVRTQFGDAIKFSSLRALRVDWHGRCLLVLPLVALEWLPRRCRQTHCYEYCANCCWTLVLRRRRRTAVRERLDSRFCWRPIWTSCWRPPSSESYAGCADCGRSVVPRGLRASIGKHELREAANERGEKTKRAAGTQSGGVVWWFRCVGVKNRVRNDWDGWGRFGSLSNGLAK